jgi:hypothetical protein
LSIYLFVPFALKSRVGMNEGMPKFTLRGPSSSLAAHVHPEGPNFIRRGPTSSLGVNSCYGKLSSRASNTCFCLQQIGAATSIIRKVEVPILDGERCAEIYPKRVIDDRVLCAGAIDADTWFREPQFWPKCFRTNYSSRILDKYHSNIKN